MCSWGPAEATDSSPLLLLHAGGDNLETWNHHAERWARTRKVYAVDFRGHGRSDWTESYSLELMKSDVVTLLDRLELDEQSPMTPEGTVTTTGSG